MWASAPCATTFSPARRERPCSKRSKLPVTCTCSSITTASAPSGTGAPVMISRASFAATASPVQCSPALTVPKTRSGSAGTRSTQRVAVARGAGKRRLVAVRGDSLTQYASCSFLQTHRVAVPRRLEAARVFQYGCKCLLETENRFTHRCGGSTTGTAWGKQRAPAGEPPGLGCRLRPTFWVRGSSCRPSGPSAPALPSPAQPWDHWEPAPGTSGRPRCIPAAASAGWSWGRRRTCRPVPDP